jgi:hypothetical protein
VTAPGYWMYETSGVLRPAVEAYLTGKEMTPEQIVAMRAYIRQWIFAPVWTGPEIESLRAMVAGITSRERLEFWLDEAEACGIDPL